MDQISSCDCFESELEEFYSAVDTFDIISFDVFDTLLLRNVIKPTDIFQILDDYARQNYHIGGFYKERISAEKEARQDAAEEDITLDVIYHILAKRFGNKADLLMEKEISLEREFLTVNSFMKNVYEYAIKKKKIIYLISDMYLPDSFVGMILKELGYTGYEKLFVSGMLGRTKRSGNLYRFLLNSDDAPVPDRWLHIGDSLWSDVEVPRQLGIHAVRYQPVRERAHVPDRDFSISESVLYALSCNLSSTPSGTDYWTRFAFQFATPVLYAAPHGEQKFLNSLSPPLLTFAKNHMGMVHFLFDESSPVRRQITDAQQRFLEKAKPYQAYLEGISPDSCFKPYMDFLIRKEQEDLQHFKSLPDGERYVICCTSSEFRKNARSIAAKAQNSLWRGAVFLSNVKEEKKRRMLYRRAGMPLFLEYTQSPPLPQPEAEPHEFYFSSLLKKIKHKVKLMMIKKGRFYESCNFGRRVRH